MTGRGAQTGYSDPDYVWWQEELFEGLGSRISSAVPLVQGNLPELFQTCFSRHACRALVVILLPFEMQVDLHPTPFCFFDLN